MKGRLVFWRWRVPVPDSMHCWEQYGPEGSLLFDSPVRQFWSEEEAMLSVAAQGLHVGKLAPGPGTCDVWELLEEEETA
jgi:hypothetical protein